MAFQSLQIAMVSGPGGTAMSATLGGGLPVTGGDASACRCAGLGALNPSALGSLPGLSAGGQADPRLFAQLQMQLVGTFLDLLSLFVNGGAGQLGGGNPLASLLGGAPAGGAGASGGSGGAANMGSTSPNLPSGPIGNVNVENIVRALPTANQKAAREHFPGILAECQRQGVTDKAQIAYILATTVHESGAGAHLEEFASGSAYEGRRDLGNTQSGDGVRFKGRGYVQVTGRNNYTDWSRRLGLDLVGNPELAEDPKIAARILVQGMKEGTFTGKKLSDYIGNGRTDFVGARRIVNGTDKASTFAATAQKILQAMG